MPHWWEFLFIATSITLLASFAGNPDVSQMRLTMLAIAYKLRNLGLKYS